MLIGITYTLRTTVRGQNGSAAIGDDAEEEFDSLETVEAVADVLRQLGHEVELLGDGEPLARRLFDGPKPDFVFNFAEGRGTCRSREAQVPALLEMLGIPYTGSDPLTLAVTLDKDCAKRLVRGAGLATPHWVVVGGEPSKFASHLLALNMPAIVKPAYEGSSKGILNASLIQRRDDLLPAVTKIWEQYRQPVLVEEFIDGDELTVGLLGNDPPRVVGIMRVVPLNREGPFVYSLEVKRDWAAQVRYECPAGISEADTHAVREAAMGVWRALGCRDVGRIDFRLRSGVPYFLEVNPLPGLAAESGDIVLLSKAMGVAYRELVGGILQAAVDRTAGKLAAAR